MSEDQTSVASYFARHAIEGVVADLLLQLGQQRPEDPILFLADQLSSRARSKSSSRPSLASLQTAGIVQERIQRLEEEIGEELPREVLAELQEVLAHDVSSAAVKNLVLQRVALQLRSEQPNIHAFVKEWVTTPDRLAAESLASSSRGSHRSSSRLSASLGVAGLAGLVPPPCQRLSCGLQMSHEQGPSCSASALPLSRVQPDTWESLVAWEFDALATENSELVRNVFCVFLGWGFLATDGVVAAADVSRMKQYIGAVCAAYERHENPYHNFKHAYSVLQGTASILRAGGSELVQASSEEQLALLVAALVHDVGHPGYNNDYFVKSRHKLAITYNDNAVLENMHCSLAFELLLMNNDKHNFTKSWSEDQFLSFRRTAVSAILNTDMKVHFDLASQLQDIKSPDEVDPHNAEQRRFLLSVFVHAADLGNPVLPTAQCQAWATRVVAEFHRQYEREKLEGLPFAPFMACRPDDTREVAKLQISFINYVVAPMWGAMACVLPKLKSQVLQMQDNLDHWQRIRDEEAASADSDTFMAA